MASEDVGSGCVRSGTQGCEIRDAFFDLFNVDFFFLITVVSSPSIYCRVLIFLSSFGF